MNNIPNIRVENIGTARKPQQVVKGIISLPCWTNYFLTETPNYLFKTSVVTGGQIALWVDATIGEGGNFFVDQEQVDAYKYLQENQERIQQAICNELRQKFPALLSKEYASWDQEAGGLPTIAELTPGFSFKNYIGPGSITIANDTKEGSAYIQWHFQCLWDPEHGFEVITHKDRVIELSPEADIFKINKDNGSFKEVEGELMSRIRVFKQKKPWWKFW